MTNKCINSTIFKNKDVIQCMNCGEQQDNTAEDYVLSGVGQISESTWMCWNCDETFTARRINKNEIEMTINW